MIKLKLGNKLNFLSKNYKDKSMDIKMSKISVKIFKEIMPSWINKSKDSMELLEIISINLEIIKRDTPNYNPLSPNIKISKWKSKIYKIKLPCSHKKTPNLMA
jgi:hypothetical protein